MSRRDEAAVDAAIAAAEPHIVRGQMKSAIRRLWEAFDGLEDPQAQRALCEKVHLVAGNRRQKALNVEVDRRRNA